MGLFDGIKEEITEMFRECVDIDLREQRYSKLKYAILKDIDSYKYDRDGGGWRSQNKVLRLIGGELIPIKTRNRIGVFYKKAGQIITAYSLLKTGEYSGRDVMKACELSWFPIKKLLNTEPVLKCVCGKPLKDHRGSCKFRFLKSEKRQKLILVWKIRRAQEKKFNNRFVKRNARRKQHAEAK